MSEALADDPQSVIATRSKSGEFKVAKTIADRRCRRMAARSDEEHKLSSFERAPARVENAPAENSGSRLAHDFGRQKGEQKHQPRAILSILPAAHSE